jgi:hypothetical protein
MDEMVNLHVPERKLRQISAALPFCNSRSATTTWSTVDVFDDYEYNVLLADCIAAKTLLSEVAVAACSYCNLLEEAIDHVKGGGNDDDNNGSTARQQKRSIRLVGMIDVTLSLYSFVTRVALLCIESKLLRTTDLSIQGTSARCRAVPHVFVDLHHIPSYEC